MIVADVAEAATSPAPPAQGSLWPATELAAAADVAAGAEIAELEAAAAAPHPAEVAAAGDRRRRRGRTQRLPAPGDLWPRMLTLDVMRGIRDDGMGSLAIEIAAVLGCWWAGGAATDRGLSGLAAEIGRAGPSSIRRTVAEMARLGWIEVVERPAGGMHRPSLIAVGPRWRAAIPGDPGGAQRANVPPAGTDGGQAAADPRISGWRGARQRPDVRDVGAERATPPGGAERATPPVARSAPPVMSPHESGHESDGPRRLSPADAGRRHDTRAATETRCLDADRGHGDCWGVARGGHPRCLPCQRRREAGERRPVIDTTRPDSVCGRCGAGVHAGELLAGVHRCAAPADADGTAPACVDADRGHGDCWGVARGGHRRCLPCQRRLAAGTVGGPQ